MKIQTVLLLSACVLLGACSKHPLAETDLKSTFKQVRSKVSKPEDIAIFKESYLACFHERAPKLNSTQKAQIMKVYAAIDAGNMSSVKNDVAKLEGTADGKILVSYMLVKKGCKVIALDAVKNKPPPIARL